MSYELSMGEAPAEAELAVERGEAPVAAGAGGAAGVGARARPRAAPLPVPWPAPEPAPLPSGVRASFGILSRGEVSEWLMVPLSKSGVRKHRGFESRPLRHSPSSWTANGFVGAS